MSAQRNAPPPITLRIATALCGLLSLLGLAQAQTPPMAYAATSLSSPLGISQAQNQLHILTYHDITSDNQSPDQDELSVSVATLVRHFSWLRDNGYQVISVDQLLAAQIGGGTLPPRAVMLTFDDAYLSFYTSVFPLLKLYNYSATLSVVGLWVESGVNDAVNANASPARRRYMTWNELADVAASGRVEIASHSFDLHRGIIANPQRNLQPSATTRAYDVLSGQYENDAEQKKRVESDLRRNNELLRLRLGKAPRVMTWPYGAHSPATERVAQDAGMPIGLTLANGSNTQSTPLAALSRILVRNDSDAADIERAMRPLRARSERVLELDLDGVFDADNSVQEQKLDALLERVRHLAPTTVYLRASSRHTDSAGAPLVYFPTQQLAIRGDLFNRTAWQLRVRLGVAVYAWLPLASLPAKFHAHNAITADGALTTLYADLFASVPLAGVYFSDADSDDDARVKALTELAKSKLAGISVSRLLSRPSLADAADSSAASIWMQRAKGLDWIVTVPPDLDDTQVVSVNGSSLASSDPVLSLGQPGSAQALRRAKALQDLWRGLGLPTDQVIWRAASNARAATQSLSAMHAAGARHLGYGMLDAALSTNGPLRRLISTERSPSARSGGAISPSSPSKSIAP